MIAVHSREREAATSRKSRHHTADILLLRLMTKWQTSPFYAKTGLKATPIIQSCCQPVCVFLHTAPFHKLRLKCLTLRSRKKNLFPFQYSKAILVTWSEGNFLPTLIHSPWTYLCAAWLRGALCTRLPAWGSRSCWASCRRALWGWGPGGAGRRRSRSECARARARCCSRTSLEANNMGIISCWTNLYFILMLFWWLSLDFAI